MHNNVLQMAISIKLLIHIKYVLIIIINHPYQTPQTQHTPIQSSPGIITLSGITSHTLTESMAN